MEGTASCESCGNSISNSDHYCSNCGNSTDLLAASKDRSQILVFISVAILFGTAMIWFLADIMHIISNNDGIYEVTSAISYVTRLLIMSIGLLLALSMKKSGMKTIAIIFASIFAAIELYWYIKSLIPEDPYLDF